MKPIRIVRVNVPDAMRRDASRRTDEGKVQKISVGKKQASAPGACKAGELAPELVARVSPTRPHPRAIPTSEHTDPLQRYLAADSRASQMLPLYALENQPGSQKSRPPYPEGAAGTVLNLQRKYQQTELGGISAPGTSIFHPNFSTFCCIRKFLTVSLQTVLPTPVHVHIQIRRVTVTPPT